LRPVRFAGAAFEEDVVWNNDGGAAVLLEDGEDVLKEVELFVARASPDCPREAQSNNKGPLIRRAAVAANHHDARGPIVSLRRRLRSRW